MKPVTDFAAFIQRLLKTIGSVGIGFVGAFLLYLLLKEILFDWLFQHIVSRLTTVFGLDIVLTQALAALLMAVLIALGSFIIARTLFEEPLSPSWSDFCIYVAAAVCLFVIYFAGEDVYFDRATGAAVKYYIKTSDGCVYSNAPDFHSRFGVRHKPLTPELFRECMMWERTQNYAVQPTLNPRHYFDERSGEPVVWYTQDNDGRIELFPLPGYNKTTGQIRWPISEEVIRELEYADMQAFDSQLFSVANFPLKLASDHSREGRRLLVELLRVVSAEDGLVVFRYRAISIGVASTYTKEEEGFFHPGQAIVEMLGTTWKVESDKNGLLRLRSHLGIPRQELTQRRGDI